MENAIHILTAEAVDLLKGMIAIPSPSFNEDEVCTHICRWMTDKGITYNRVGNNIMARLSEQLYADPKAFEGKPTLMLCAHIDTVSPSNEYSFDPYNPDYTKAAEVIGSEDIVPGLGSNDDGASVVSMIAAFRYFLNSINACTSEQSISLPSCSASHAGIYAAQDILLVLSCEEERSGVNGMTGLWSEIKADVDYAIVGEPTCMQAATAERGLLVIDATAHGVSGHAARNEGINAIEIAIEDIERIRMHEFSKISPRMGKVNLNVTQINAGTAHNVIPDICTFVIDVRPTEQYSNEDILKELQSICRSELKARNLSNCSSATSENSILQRTAERLGIGTFSSPTTSDWMRIDCDAIKMGPGNSSRSHKKDEFVYISEIENGINTYIDFINNL